MDEQTTKVINIKVPFEMHRKLKMQAVKEGITIKDLLIKLATEYCDAKDEE